MKPHADDSFSFSDGFQGPEIVINIDDYDRLYRSLRTGIYIFAHGQSFKS